MVILFFFKFIYFFFIYVIYYDSVSSLQQGNKTPVQTIQHELSAIEALRATNILRNEKQLRDLGFETAEEKAAKKLAERQAKILEKQNKPVVTKAVIPPRDCLRSRTSEENAVKDDDIQHEHARKKPKNDDDNDDDDDDDDDNKND